MKNLINTRGMLLYKLIRKNFSKLPRVYLILSIADKKTIYLEWNAFTKSNLQIEAFCEQLTNKGCTTEIVEPEIIYG